jgi:PAS domain S-box-containing protein
MISTVFRREFLEAVLESVPLLVANVESGEILYATAAVEALFGCPVRNGLIGKQVEDVVPPELRETHAQRLRKEYAKNPRSRQMETGLTLNGLHADGHTFPIQILLTPMMVDRQLCATAVILDLSGRKSLETT